MGSMKKTHSVPYLYEDKPLFGLDIGHSTVRVMQLVPGRQRPKVIGYGEIAFKPTVIENGVIQQHGQASSTPVISPVSLVIL